MPLGEKLNNEATIKDLYINLMKKTLSASVYDESAWKILDPGKRAQSAGLVKRLSGLLKNFVIEQLGGRSILLVKQNPFNLSDRVNGKDWPMFGYTMVGHKRLDNVQECVENVLKNKVPGDFVETGSWRGGTTIFMRALLKAYNVVDRKVWVADSFEGLPAPKDEQDGPDLSSVDYLKVSLEQVKANFKRFDLLDPQVQFLKGWFCDTLPNAPIDQIAILRLDGDMYSSTMDSLQNLYHKVSKNGYVIIDDYHSWPSCHQAVTDFRTENNITSEIVTIDWTGAYWRVK